MEYMEISREELKTKLDRGDDFKLVMTMGDWQFMAKHIPGSIQVQGPQDAHQKLSKDDEIVVYCSSPECAASQAAYRMLMQDGYSNIKRYAGGIVDWEDAGYPLEGSMVE